LTCMACAGFFLVAALLFGALGAASTSGKRAGSKIPVALALLGGLITIPAGVSGGWWLNLERTRKSRENDLNQDYLAARKAYREAIAKEKQEWQDAVATMRESAQGSYNSKVREREQIVQAMGNEVERRRRAHEQAEKAVAHEEREWQAAANRTLGSIDAAKSELERARSQYGSLDGEYQADRLKLQAKARELQLHQFLSNHLIEDADIEKIGPGRTAALASFGIETALDVMEHAIRGVPGFGPAYTQNLLNWRQSIERKFVFDAKKGVPIHEQQALEQKYQLKKEPLEKMLASGNQQLQDIASRGRDELRRLRERIDQHVVVLGQARADLRSIPIGL
jgi:hypothetical protein